MARSDLFRLQHDALLAAIATLEAQLPEAGEPIDAESIRTTLCAIIGKLNTHLTMEDKSLYPSLLDHESEALRALARRFVGEMGGIKEAVQAYSRLYPSAASIVARPEAFVLDTKRIVEALKTRIGKEDHELYPELDRVE